MEITLKILKDAMDATVSKDPTFPGFLIDGFPRKMDQAVKFDETVCLSAFVLFFCTTEDVMLKRLLVRGQTSGREDDNAESIKKRFRTYIADTMPVIEYYTSQGKVAKVDSTGTVDAVHLLSIQVVCDALAGKYSTKIVD